MYCREKQHEERLQQWSEMTQDEHESERDDPGRNNKKKKKKKKQWAKGMWTRK